MNFCMKEVLLILFVSLVLQEDVVSSKNETNSTSLNITTPTTSTSLVSTTRTTPTNGTIVGKEDLRNNDNGMLERSLYVAIALSALVAIYFIVRWIKTKRRRKAKKYGVIHGTGEMEPLDKHVDEDEEDMTLFDMKDSKRPR